ncbi:hypothetical protein EXIGLDRAFT_779652 [Exidia glandulosa HHB12029]|uniref:Uncharacterized protein n=1 Tax=Exidia glandulosa HHB12029 TaxID=1314781 RepID=A0A165ZCQ6_EXIGL|nr:hypothetical protein EXIGLDRAFT_779652 [Exidia glandulosa HHB12029]
MPASPNTNSPRLDRDQVAAIARAPSFPTSDRVPPRWSKDSSRFIDEKKTNVDNLDVDFVDVELQELPPPKVVAVPRKTRQRPDRGCDCGILKSTAIITTVVLVWAGWFLYLMFYILADVWPVPRVWMNTQNGAATGVGILSFFAGVAVSSWLLTLLIPLSFGCIGIRSKHTGISFAVYGVSSIVVMGFVSAILICVWQTGNICGKETPYPIFIAGYSSPNGAYAAVYNSDQPGSSLVEEYVLAEDTATSAVTLSLLNDSSDTSELQVSYDMDSGVATAPALNTTANFTPGAMGPIDFPALRTALELAGNSSAGVQDFSLVQSNSNGTRGVIFSGAVQSSTSCGTIKICSARIPSQNRQLLVPLGLAMFFQNQNSQLQNSWTC